jgi:hypothetical protein
VNLRRLLSLLLVLTFGLPTVAPALGLAAGAQANLRACCRRNGAHHCMEAATPPMDGHAASARFPRCPALPAVVSNLRPNVLAAPAASPIFSITFTRSARLRQTEARARVALDRARHKRGPPAVRLS